MKKFSKMFKSIKNNEPKKVSGIEFDIQNIVESSLNISVEGEIDDYLEKNIGIEGKDKLIESLIKYVEKSNEDKEDKILEKVMYQGLDRVLLEKQTAGSLKKHRQRVLSLLEKDDVEKKAKQQANAIKNGEKAYYRGMTAEQLIADHPEKKKDLKKIKDIFVFRSKQLGYRN